MGQLVKYLTVTVIAAALAVPAVAASGPSSAAGSPLRGTDATAAALATSPDRGDFFPRHLPKAVAVLRTGGFAGLSQSVVIRETGRWRYSDWRRPGANANGQLNRWQMRRLTVLLSDPELEPALVWHRPPIGCADAFEYSLAVGGRHYTAGYTDCRNPGGPMVALVDAVIAFTPL